jgi:hypothetical protein
MAANPWAKKVPGMTGDFEQRMAELEPFFEKGVDVWGRETEYDSPVFEALKAAPTWQTLLTDKGLMPEQYTLGYEGVLPEFEQRLDKTQLNREALDELTRRGMGEGISEWGELMLERSDVQRAEELDAAARMAATGEAAAFSELARRGGVGAGARERLAEKSMFGMMEGKQEALREGSKRDLAIQIKDEEMKSDILKSIPGMEAQAFESELKKQSLWGEMARMEAVSQMEAQKFNVAAALDEITQGRKFEMGRWQELMKALGTEMTARAQEEAGKK